MHFNAHITEKSGITIRLEILLSINVYLQKKDNVGIHGEIVIKAEYFNTNP